MKFALELQSAFIPRGLRGNIYRFVVVQPIPHKTNAERQSAYRVRRNYQQVVLAVTKPPCNIAETKDLQV